MKGLGRDGDYAVTVVPVTIGKVSGGCRRRVRRVAGVGLDAGAVKEDSHGAGQVN
jgi:hypothetical protein